MYNKIKSKLRKYGGNMAEETLKDRVKKSLDKVRPALQADGGDVVFVDLTEDNVVKVKLTGACGGCPMAQMTLKNGIEKFLKKELPEIKSVEPAS